MLRTRVRGTIAGLAFALASSPLAADVAVVCHRGANQCAPENTIAAARKCVEWGVPWIEVDVRTSKDGVLYILHDSSVDRTTNGKGRLRTLSSDEIDKLDAGSWFDPKFAGERIPRVEEYLKWIKGKSKVYFDVKDANVKQLIDLVYACGMENDCFFWFGNPVLAFEFRRLDKKLALKVNASTPDEVRRANRQLGATIVEVPLESLTPELKQTCQELKIATMVYHPKKDPEGFREIIRRGADMVNLDHGDLFMEVQREVNARTTAQP